MSKTHLSTAFASILATAAASICLVSGAVAQDTSSPELTKDQAKDLKTQSDADYKARKKIADAKADLNTADCKTSTEGGVQRACKTSVKGVEKQDKANAKMVHEAEKADIKANTAK